MDALIDLNVLIDAVANREPFVEDSEAAIQSLRQQGHRLFIYAGSVQTLRYQTVAELMRQREDLSRGQALRFADKLLDPFVRDFDWLAALAGEGAGIFGEEDPEDAQLSRAIDRLGQDAILLTRDKGLLESCPQARSPRQILEQPKPDTAPAIEFIDLKAQQARVRPQLESRLHSVLHHGRYIMGSEVRELEERLAAYVGVKHCIGVSSGTDSLLIAMMALGVGPGDEVITAPYTWISTAEMIALLGAKPVFVDIEETTLNMDPTKLEAAITDKTKAIMPVGIYGQTTNMTAINEIAARHGNLPVIEDAAQSFGATHHGKRSCSLSTIGSTSFFPSKPLGCYGDGGALFTDDDELAQSMRQIRVHGQAKKHHHPILGLNGRLDTVQAAVVLAKLEIFDDEVARRQEVAASYNHLLQSVASGNSLRLPKVAEANTSVYAQYTVLSPERDALNARLKARGIPSVSYYAVPLHLQPVFSELGHKRGDFPITEQVAEQCLSLPMSPGLTSDQITQIAEALQSHADS